MKYYNKDYENFVVDQDTETRIEKQQQVDEVNKEMEKRQRPFKSIIDVYRERNNGYPSYSILFLSLIVAAIITLIATLLIEFIIVDLNITTYLYLERLQARYLLVWVLAIMIITYLILNYAKWLFVKEDEHQKN